MNPLVLSAATVRLTTLITSDEITAPLRYMAEDAARGARVGSLPERLNYLVSCPRCVSVWAAGGLLVASQTRPGRFLVKVLALSQAVVTTVNTLDKWGVA